MAIALTPGLSPFFIVMIDKLIQFARTHHAGFEGMPDKQLRVMFEKYAASTLIWRDAGEIKGFAIYQEWPDRLNFIAIAGKGSRSENLKAILAGRHDLPRKMICYFDEEKMELKICQRQQPVG